MSFIFKKWIGIFSTERACGKIHLFDRPKSYNSIANKIIINQNHLFPFTDTGCRMSEFVPRIDLVAEAKNHIAFLELVDRTPLLRESQVILNAIRR